MDKHDDFKNPKPHAAPVKSVVDAVVELAINAGGGAVTLLSGLLAAVLILYSGYVLYDTFNIQQQASSSAWDLVQFKPELLSNEGASSATSELAAINQNYRAWLTVYDTAIDYPVVQGPDDLYYASHNIYNEVSLTGAIYLAAGNSGDFSDSYNVIYGHHMDNGAMFGGLDHMSGKETGVIVTQDAVYDVEFFAVITTDAYESSIYSVGDRMDSVLDFLRSGGEGGIGVGTKVLYFDEDTAADAVKLVALSTCTDAVTSGRLVVIGKMIKRPLTLKSVVIDPTDTSTLFGEKNLTATTKDGKKQEFEFTLTLTGSTNTSEPLPAAGTKAKVSYAAGETGKKTIPFGTIEFTKSGTYQYTITEAKPGSGWTTKGSPVTVTVTVWNNGKGALEAKVTSSKTITNTYSVKTSGGYTTTTKKPESLTIYNNFGDCFE